MSVCGNIAWLECLLADEIAAVEHVDEFGVAAVEVEEAWRVR